MAVALRNPNQGADQLDDLELVLHEDAKPLIPSGEYQVICAGFEKNRHFGGIKLYVRFEVCDGPHGGTKLFKAYNWYEKSKARSDIAKDLILLSGQRGRRAMKLPLALFRNKVLSVQVRTVISDRKQTPLPEHLQYSVVDRILGVLAGATGGGR